MKFATFQNPVVFETLNKLFAAPLPVKTAYRLSKVQKLIASEAEKYQELRTSLIKKFGETKEDGTPDADEHGNVKIKEGGMEELVAEMKDLHEIEVELPFTVTVDELEKIDLTTYDLSILEDVGLLKE